MKRIAAAAALLAVPLAAASLALPASASPAHHHRYVRVPDVEGRQFGGARRVIDRARLRARAIPRAEGIVAYEVPAPGTKVRAGSVVRLHMAATG